MATMPAALKALKRANVGKVIPLQVELLHPAEGKPTKLLTVQAIKYGPTVMITAVASNGATLDETLAELEAFLEARHQPPR